MCFPEIDKIQEGLELPEDYERRTGYRLPTSAEWECFCRAGTTTRLSFGSDSALLRRYGWHAENSGRELQPVGLLQPNDFGLFDTYGLAHEWCSDRIDFSPGVEERIFRGSSRFSEASHVASALPGVSANRPTYLGNECGLRIVRTMPAGP
jgi:formylglycine-generating enzyme required for sulfatase activity